MPRYVATIVSAWPAARALTYMADFSHASEWDPSVISSTALDAGPVREGSTYELHIRSGRRVLRYLYRVERLEPGAVVLRSATRWFESVDTITVRDAGAGSEITYDAFLTAKGALRLANTLVARVLRKLGDAARDRLSVVLSQ